MAHLYHNNAYLEWASGRQRLTDVLCLIAMTKIFTTDIAGLPSPPVKREEFDAWATWAGRALRKGRSSFLRDPAILADDETGDRISVASRALIAYATESKPYPEHAPSAMLSLFNRAHSISPMVLRAAEILARRVMERGATSADVLYLVATFAWPLRDVSPDIGDRAWAYLVHAPWQTDISVLTELCKAVDRAGAHSEDRSLLRLADSRLEAGIQDGAKDLLEAIAAIQADVDRIEDITSDASFGVKQKITSADQAILRLGRLYVEDQETMVHARAVLERAARLEPEPDAMVQILRERTWDRPFAELYAWSKELSRPESLDAEVDRLLQANQPHHARRLAEAALVRHFDEPIFRPSDRSIVKTIGRFQKTEAAQILERSLARRAAEHLAILYSRTNYYTAHARDFVGTLVQLTGFTGAGGPLSAAKSELEMFVNRGDPYLILTEEDPLLAQTSRMSEEELRTRDAVRSWLTERFGGANRGAMERTIAAITSPIGDLTRSFGNLPGIEKACQAAFRTLLQGRGAITGNLEPWFEEGKLLRAEKGISLDLLERARGAGRYEKVSAAAVSGVSAFLPPGLSVAAGAADLGATLLVTYRAIARVGALFGRDVRTADGFRFTSDSFALGCSSGEGEGLVAYLGRGKKRVLAPLTLGGVAYGAKMFAEYLWTTPGTTGRIAAEQAVRHLARLCGIGLSERSVARVVPVGGALLSGMAAYAFIRQVVEASIHVAARDALLRSAGLEGKTGETDTLSEAVGAATAVGSRGSPED